jgi:hypothetical protein
MFTQVIKEGDILSMKIKSKNKIFEIKDSSRFKKTHNKRKSKKTAIGQVESDFVTAELTGYENYKNFLRFPSEVIPISRLGVFRNESIKENYNDKDILFDDVKYVDNSRKVINDWSMSDNLEDINSSFSELDLDLDLQSKSETVPNKINEGMGTTSQPSVQINEDKDDEDLGDMQSILNELNSDKQDEVEQISISRPVKPKPKLKTSWWQWFIELFKGKPKSPKAPKVPKTPKTPKKTGNPAKSSKPKLPPKKPKESIKPKNTPISFKMGSAPISNKKKNELKLPPKMTKSRINVNLEKREDFPIDNLLKSETYGFGKGVINKNEKVEK